MNSALNASRAGSTLDVLLGVILALTGIVTLSAYASQNKDRVYIQHLWILMSRLALYVVWISVGPEQVHHAVLERGLEKAENRPGTVVGAVAGFTALLLSVTGWDRVLIHTSSLLCGRIGNNIYIHLLSIGIYWDIFERDSERLMTQIRIVKLTHRCHFIDEVTMRGLIRDLTPLARRLYGGPLGSRMMQQAI